MRDACNSIITEKVQLENTPVSNRDSSIVNSFSRMSSLLFPSLSILSTLYSLHPLSPSYR